MPLLFHFSAVISERLRIARMHGVETAMEFSEPAGTYLDYFL